MGAYFGYNGVWIGLSFLSAAGPSSLARNKSGQEAQESLEGCSSLPLLDSVVERNRVAFDNETFSMYRLKNSFICSFWSWSNVSSGDRDTSLLEFLTWMGYR